jgi:hypothetical protein
MATQHGKEIRKESLCPAGLSPPDTYREEIRSSLGPKTE